MKKKVSYLEGYIEFKGNAKKMSETCSFKRESTQIVKIQNYTCFYIITFRFKI